MAPSEKDAVSHRGRALEKLARELEKWSRSGYNNKETGK
jgi:inosine/xanthosine triphosphate pyrophosphatase family protein